MSPAVARISGYSTEEILSMPIESVVSMMHPDDIERVKRAIGEPMTSDRASYLIEYRFRHKDGQYRWLSDLFTVVKDAEGRPLYLVGNVRDITEQKRMETQLIESQKMNAIAQLASGVAHEVRNPLNAILAVTEALSLDIKEDLEHRIYLDHIRSQVDRLSILMRDLLDLGKPIQPSNLKRESLPELCEAGASLWKESTSFKTHKVRMVYPREASGISVVADRSRFQQAFLNLLENAAQHSPEESEIELSILKMGAASLGIRIRDKGTGIPQENLSQVFEPFYTTRRDGIGLGLSVVKQIIESHNGAIRIYNNDPPPGCTVEVTLPIAQEA